MSGYLKVDGDEPALQALVGPDEHVAVDQLRGAAPLVERAHAVAHALEARHAEVQGRSATRTINTSVGTEPDCYAGDEHDHLSRVLVYYLQYIYL